MTIIVGRGRSKATQRIEISDTTVSREHCWLTDNGDGTYTLQNKSPQGTYVDGRKILKTCVTPDTYIKLSETTTVKVSDLLPIKPVTSTAVDPPTPQGPPEFSIMHLKQVWDDYHERLLDIQRNQRNINLLRSASPMFTIGSGSVATLAKTMGWGEAIFGFTLVLTLIGLGLMIYSFIKGFNDRSIEERAEATEEFTHKYVCPNPKCKRFMGNQSYHVIRQNKNCPWCKCKFTEQ